MNNNIQLIQFSPIVSKLKMIINLRTFVVALTFFWVIHLVSDYSAILPIYEFKEKLGEGASGSVWKCKTPKEEPFAIEHPYVAVKIIKYPYQESEKEVQLLKKLSHR